MKITFKSPLSINKCVEKIQEVRKRNSSSVFLYHPILPFPSEIQDNRICLGHRSGGRNSFSPVFLGQFSSANENQAELTGKLVIHPFVKVFMVLWMSFTSFFASLLLVARIKDSIIDQKAFQIGAPELVLLLPIGGLLLLIFGNAFGQSDGKAIIKLLEETLQVTSIEESSSSTILSKFNLISMGIIALFIYAGAMLGSTANYASLEISTDAKLISFFACDKPSEKECVSTNYFEETPNEIYACGYIQTSSPTNAGVYWYHESVQTPIYYSPELLLEEGFFCEKLDIGTYESGQYSVMLYKGREILGEYKFVVK